jgi:hypothetical protein
MAQQNEAGFVNFVERIDFVRRDADEHALQAAFQDITPRGFVAIVVQAGGIVFSNECDEVARFDVHATGEDIRGTRQSSTWFLVLAHG